MAPRPAELHELWFVYRIRRADYECRRKPRSSRPRLRSSSLERIEFTAPGVAERLENQGCSYLGTTCFRSPLFAVLRNGFPLLFLLGTYACSELKKDPRDHYHDRMDRKRYIQRVQLQCSCVLLLYGVQEGRGENDS